MNKTPWRRGYKVVRTMGTVHPILVSANYSTLRYILGQVTTPCPGWGPLACFRCLKDARVFASWSCRSRIFRCSYQPAHGKAGAALWSPWGSYLLAPSLPRGTVLAKSIKLTSRVPKTRRPKR